MKTPPTLRNNSREEIQMALSMMSDQMNSQPGPSGSGTVLVNVGDTTAGYLAPKLAAGPGIALSVLNPGGNEQVQITNTGGGRTMFVYRPGALAPLPQNVYNNWTALMADFANANGALTIQFDDSIVSPCVIPAGTWDLKGAILVGNLVSSHANNSPVQVQCADGCVFLRLAEISDNIAITATSNTTPVYTMLASGILILGLGAIIDASGSAPFVDAPGPYPANNEPIIGMLVGGQIGTVPGRVVVTVEDTTAGLGIFMLDAATTIEDGSVAGSGLFILLAASPVVFLMGGLNTPPTFPGITGAFYFFNLTNGQGYEFGAGALGDLTNPSWVPPGWATLTPTFVAVPGGPAGPRKTMAWPGCTMVMFVQHVGDPANAGQTVTYEFYVDGTAVPAMSVTLPADTSSGVWSAGAVGHSVGWGQQQPIQILATPSAPLAAPVTNISAVVY